MLFDSIILEVAIGLVFIYLLLSLVCTAASEFISRIFAMRSNNMEKGIRNLLNNGNKGDLASDFYKHPLIKSLSRQGFIDKNILRRDGKPSYISSRMFAIVLFDLISPGNNKPKNTKDLRIAIEAKIPDNETKKALLALIDDSNGYLKVVRNNIEGWFNEEMDRVTGWYTRNMQTVVLALALVISIVANADTIMIANTLASDSALRESMISSASEFVNNSNNNSNPETMEAPIATLGIVPLGWSSMPFGFWAWFYKIFGFLITTFAISLGAPFWFDLLKKMVNLRSTGKPQQ